MGRGRRLGTEINVDDDHDHTNIPRARRLSIVKSRASNNDHLPPPPPPPTRNKHASLSVKKKSSGSFKSWWTSPETKRKKRVAKYKLYAVEGKVKSSFKKGCRWIKKTCSRIVHGA
ncbi:hypothetical protein Tsubulata_039132 [Turnera subulata]|uniref:DUF3511 domain-containing protein n=1 Tax=Turnera subulata TaxID=218843 RepID=A0A9Q0J058_9ROSI|nr:hypothetical protein Tsubulata_039132 [Turnera subulata]